MFNFTETTVQEIMLPLIDVVAVEKSITCQEARQISSEKSHIRLPVYDERIDRIIGVLHTLELLGVDPQEPISSFVRPAFYVPQSKSIKDLMSEMRTAGTVIAVVVDEFGGTEGIITIEDIMEEIVEDLEDEYDISEDSSPWIRRLGENDYLVNARIEVAELREKLQIELPEGRYVILAGLILDRTHRVPEKGMVIKENGISLVIHHSTSCSGSSHPLVIANNARIKERNS